MRYRSRIQKPNYKGMMIISIFFIILIIGQFINLYKQNLLFLNEFIILDSYIGILLLIMIIIFIYSFKNYKEDKDNES